MLNASNYYYLAEKGFTQSLFWLQSWKVLYEKDKTEFVTSKYNLVKKGLTETFETTESLIINFENKAFASLQRYMIFVTASRILRKFLFLSEKEQSKLIEVTISKLGGAKNEFKFKNCSVLIQNLIYSNYKSIKFSSNTQMFLSYW